RLPSTCTARIVTPTAARGSRPVLGAGFKLTGGPGIDYTPRPVHVAVIFPVLLPVLFGRDTSCLRVRRAARLAPALAARLRPRRRRRSPGGRFEQPGGGRGMHQGRRASRRGRGAAHRGRRR